MSAELKAAYQTELLLLCFDVRSEEETTKALGNLPEEWAAIDVLVNNAGLASGLEPIQDGDTTDWNKMIDTNIKGLLYVTKTIAPRMMEARKGHIINLGSMAGRQVYPNGAVYCATKHAVDALSQGMRLDLLPYGIKVSQVMPGAVEIEFSEVRFHGNKACAKSVYDGFEPLRGEDIDVVSSYIVNLPPHV